MEESESGRVEVAQRVHRVEAPIDGELLSVRAVLRQTVQQGDVLVILDAEEQEEHLAEAQRKLEALDSRAAVVAQELRLTQELARRQAQAAIEASKEARLQHQQESISSEFATLEFEKSATLREAGLISEVDWLRLQGESERHRAMADSAAQAIVKLEAEQRSADAESQTTQIQLQRELLMVGEERIALEFELDHMRHEKEDRSLRSPVAGVVGSITELRSGSFIEAGDPIAEIVPIGEVTVNAAFRPSALGRLRPGQSATLRLDAYPWPQHGTVPLIVERLASEPDEGMIRVELRPLESAAPTAILEHGLTGTVDIEVERISPLQWLLRAAGSRQVQTSAAAPSKS